MEDRPTARVVDLSHVITEGMVTYKGLAWPPHLRLLSRDQSAANTTTDQRSRSQDRDGRQYGTYVDVPSHRFADGKT